MGFTYEVGDIVTLMIKIAVNDAVRKIDKEVESKMGAYGSSFNGLF